MKKKRTKAATEIVKAKKAELVWTHGDYERELEKAKKIGPKKMADEALVSFCHGVHSYFHAHFFADARPFFLELWRRIKTGEFHITKTAACERIGCTRQWANAIVSGRADERRKARAKAKEAKRGNRVSAVSAGTIPSDEEYVREILNHAFANLRPLLSNHWDRYRKICAELAKQFEEASKTPPTSRARAVGAD
jgi:hypothetical protein